MAVKVIGTLDKDKFRNIAENIRGTEVVLTEKQIAHIIERRGEKFYQEYSNFFPDIIADPDYVFADTAHENTALACKRVTAKGKSVNLVIRLAVESDKAERKHSVITAIIENDKRFAQRLRNNIPAYDKNIAKPE